METASTTETMTELSTSERFSLKREAEHTVKQDIHAKAGVSVSAKYGAAEFSANAGLDYSNSKTDSQKVASEYAKDVTSCASTKVTESMRVQQTTHTLETFEENDDHSFDNTGPGGKNVSGIYQWVNKVYTAQVFNYGKRLLFDIMVPEPAALLLDAANISTKSATPVAPTAFTALPAKLDFRNPDNNPNYYGNFLAPYDVQGVNPPPIDNISVAKAFNLTRDDKAINKSGEITVPAGYEAIKVCVEAMYNWSEEKDHGLQVFVANVKYLWHYQKLDSPILPPEANKYVDLTPPCSSNIAVAIECWHARDYAVSVQIECRPTEEARHKWQLETHSKILAAYQQKISNYQDEVAAQQMSQAASGGPLGSANPETNRITERTELKRGAIQILTQDDLLRFNNISEDRPGTGPNTAISQLFPRPNPVLATQNGAFARFFEQSFEWEQMQYVFYPYYWSRKSVWYDKLSRANDDPLFAEFLKAGQARVVVPVRPSMEPAVWYYLMTGRHGWVVICRWSRIRITCQSRRRSKRIPGHLGRRSLMVPLGTWSSR
jgi:hypothetical protein